MTPPRLIPGVAWPAPENRSGRRMGGRLGAVDSSAVRWIAHRFFRLRSVAQTRHTKMQPRNRRDTCSDGNDRTALAYDNARIARPGLAASPKCPPGDNHNEIKRVPSAPRVRAVRGRPASPQSR